MLHVTFNNGYTARFTCPVEPQAIESMLPLIPNGGPIPGHEPFRVVVNPHPGGFMFTIEKEKEPITLSCLAYNAQRTSALWFAIQSAYLAARSKVAATTVPPEPDELPWLATVLLPGMNHLSPQHVYWISILEHTFAEALIQKHNCPA